MKYCFNATIRGNVGYESREALISEIESKLAQVPGFTKTASSVEVWVDGEGKPRLFEDGNKRFTVMLSGYILADGEDVVQTIINGFCVMYPQFTLTYQSVQALTVGAERLKYNDDGSPYVEPIVVPEATETTEAPESAPTEAT